MYQTRLEEVIISEEARAGEGNTSSRGQLASVEGQAVVFALCQAIVLYSYCALCVDKVC